jgi:hypothetical protein
MNDRDSKRIEDFLTKWLGSEGNERANYQTFFGDLCVALDIPSPPPKGSVDGDRYYFNKKSSSWVRMLRRRDLRTLIMQRQIQLSVIIMHSVGFENRDWRSKYPILVVS